MVIPVGGRSVEAVALYCPDKAVLPPREAIETCLDKWETMRLARSCSVPAPETHLVGTREEAESLNIRFPCVLKPRRETDQKFTFYVSSKSEFSEKWALAEGICRKAGQSLPLIQERVHGAGVGFFALCQRGEPKWIFMHRRLREWPVTGGPSTAAASFYHPQLKEYGSRILKALQWHGVAMVEFKFDEGSQKFSLMEINPKFWGSLELGLRAGVNFPAGLVRVFNGEEIPYSEEYDRHLKFYWPLPDDLRALRELGKLRQIYQYFLPHSATNMFHYPALDLFGLLRFLLR
jgi:predicted ATP-grasp superfamily ATP-dependent carboligase